MLWNDPDRWVSADQQRDEWVKLGLWLAALVTLTCIAAGIFIMTRV